MERVAQVPQIAFNAVSLVTSVPAGTSTKPGRVVLATEICPNGAHAFLETFRGKVVDVGNSDQIYFALERNSMPIGKAFARIPGESFDFNPELGIGEQVHSGEISIVAYNISGMLTSIEPAALAGVPVRCQAQFTGRLLAWRAV